MKTEFSSAQISRIIDQALIYQCACPAQVATTLLELRDLYDYQMKCLQGTDVDRRVHEAIARATQESHARLEQCLHEVLAIEEWDPETLALPSGLKKKPTKSI